MPTFAELQQTAKRLAPRTAVVLGSGLGTISGFHEILSVPFSQITGVASPTVGGHAGRVAIGEWYGRPVLVLFGRLHFYEGHSWNAVTAPVNLAAELGTRRLILTNAAGGIHSTLFPGSLMALRGHIALLDQSAWKNPEPRMPYSKNLTATLGEMGIIGGNYAAVTGPCYETPAEIRALRTLGADAVGMSTAREADAAEQLGLEVAAISCITNRAAGLGDSPLDHLEVLANAKQAVSQLGEAIGRLIA